MSTEQLSKAFAMTRGILANVTPEQYEGATPCAQWNVRRLANHIVEGANWFPLCVNAGAAPEDDPTYGVDYAAGDLMASYDQGVAASLAAFGAPGAQEQTIKLPFGELPTPLFMAVAMNDVFTHGWDLAKATGQRTDLDPELAATLLEQMQGFITDDFRGPEGEGLFGPPVEVPAATPPADKLAAFLGRRP